MSSALMHTYNRAPQAFDHGRGAWLYTTDGEAYLDFGAGIAVTSLGHAHPHLVEALKSQAEKLWHTSNLYTMPLGEKLAARLCAATFADRVFFTNSGAEAMECAIKTARRYQSDKGAPERFRIITFEGAFHGRTLATIAAGGKAQYLEGFGPPMEGFDQVPLEDVDALKAAIGPQTGGILIEPVQGEGGIRNVSTSFLRTIESLCREHGLLMILDEVQSGMGRTGKLFAHEWAGVTPDIMAVAKGIGGGFPLGACLAREEVAAAMVPGTHGSTYGGNPLAMAVGNAVLDVVLEDGFIEQVAERGLYLKQQLAGLLDRYDDLLKDVRGTGLLAGLECKIPNSDLINALYEQHMLAVAAGDNVVRIMPPLTVSTEEIDTGVARLDAALAACRKGDGND